MTEDGVSELRTKLQIPCELRAKSKKVTYELRTNVQLLFLTLTIVDVYNLSALRLCGYF